MDLYAENILEHYHHPHSKRVLASPTLTHEEQNPSCGDRTALSLMLEGDIITEIGWAGEGCAISQAGMSMVSDDLRGKTTDQVLAFTQQNILDHLGVTISPRRLTCALLPLHVIQNTIRAYKKLPQESWSETLAKAQNAY